MKKTITMLLSLVMLLSALVGSFGLSSSAKGGKMAINIYCNPVTNETSGKYDAFTIEFRGEAVNVDGKQTTAPATYWALANFSMDTSSKENRKKFPSMSGGGCYAGIQRTGYGDTDRTAILSFWEWRYRGNELHQAHRVYPEGPEHYFGGEGEGTNWITYYPWEDNEWYRMLLRSWNNPETGTTYVAEWFQKVSTGEWTLISMFDTGLIDSCFQGNMSQFMENFGESVSDYDRKFNYRNIYVVDHKDGEWKSLYKTNMSCDYNATNKDGTREFGSDGEVFWGVTNGTKLDDYASYNATAQRSGSFEIKQPEKPSFDAIAISNLSAKVNNKALRVTWDETGSPMLSYKLELTDRDGKTVYTSESSVPGGKIISIKDYTTDEVNIKLTATDVFGNTVEATGVSEKIDEENKKAALVDFVENGGNFVKAASEETYDALVSDIASAKENEFKSGVKGLYNRMVEFKEGDNFLGEERVNEIKAQIEDFLAETQGKKATGKYADKAAKITEKANSVLKGGIKESEVDSFLADMKDVKDNAFGLGALLYVIIAAAALAVAAVVVIVIVKAKKKKNA